APLLLCERARTAADLIAFRSKHLGLYRERSWRDYAELVARAARAFATLGVEQGDRVAFFVDTCVESVVWILASLSLVSIVSLRPLTNTSHVRMRNINGACAAPCCSSRKIRNPSIISGRSPTNCVT